MSRVMLWVLGLLGLAILFEQVIIAAVAWAPVAVEGAGEPPPNKCDLGRAAGMPDLDCGPGRHMTEEARGEVCHRECVDDLEDAADPVVFEIDDDKELTFGPIDYARMRYATPRDIWIEGGPGPVWRITTKVPLCIRFQSEEWMHFGGVVREGCKGSK